jgi:hypothetical protein
MNVKENAGDLGQGKSAALHVPGEKATNSAWPRLVLASWRWAWQIGRASRVDWRRAWSCQLEHGAWKQDPLAKHGK